MKQFLAGVAALGMVITASAASAAEGEGAAIPSYPLKEPKEQSWSFTGPFGTFDKAQLQRGLKIYRQVCSACHSMDLVAFRNLEALGYSEAQVRTIAQDYQITDGPNDSGEMFQRPGKPSDHFPPPFANPEQAAASNNGAVPPDMSLLAKARGVERGFPQFIFDIFTQYTAGGPDYIYSILTGYEDPPKGEKVPPGGHYNPYFAHSAFIAMPPPLSDGVVPYEDGTPEKVDQYAKDVAAFLMWASEPHMEARKQTGFTVMVFLIIFSGLVFMTKRKIWADTPH